MLTGGEQTNNTTYNPNQPVVPQSPAGIYNPPQSNPPIPLSTVGAPNINAYGNLDRHAMNTYLAESARNQRLGMAVNAGDAFAKSVENITAMALQSYTTHEYYNLQTKIAQWGYNLGGQQIALQEKAIDTQQVMQTEQLESQEKVARIQMRTETKIARITESERTERARIYAANGAFDRSSRFNGLPNC